MSFSGTKGWNTKPKPGVMLNPLHPLSRGLVGYWLFNEGAGSLANDISGHNNHCSLINNPIWTGSKYGGGLKLNGNNDYGNCGEGNGYFDFSTQYSFDVWIFPILNNESAIIEKGYFTGNGGFMVWYWNDNILIYVRKGIRSQVPISTLEWTHITVTWDGDYTRIYKNGVLADEDAYDVAPEDNNESLLIGKYSTHEFNGILDNTRIYTHALSAEEVKQLHHNPFCNLLQVPIRRYSPAVPPVGVIMNQFQRANIGADLYNGVFA